MSGPTDKRELGFQEGWAAAWAMFESGIIIQRAKAEDQVHMVWAEGGPAPKKLHWNWVVTAKECERLARANPGKRFHVISSVRTYYMPPDAPLLSKLGAK